MQTKPFKQLSKSTIGGLTKLFRRDRLLSVKEVAGLVGKSEKVIYYQIRVGNLPAEEHYGILLVRESNLKKITKRH